MFNQTIPGPPPGAAVLLAVVLLDVFDDGEEDGAGVEFEVIAGVLVFAGAGAGAGAGIGFDVDVAGFEGAGAGVLEAFVVVEGLAVDFAAEPHQVFTPLWPLHAPDLLAWVS